jgi:hypothetical protein
VLERDTRRYDGRWCWLWIKFRSSNVELDWSRKLRQAVKAQISSNGEESLEFVKKEVHEGVQAGRGAEESFAPQMCLEGFEQAMKGQNYKVRARSIAMRSLSDMQEYADVMERKDAVRFSRLVTQGKISEVLAGETVTVLDRNDSYMRDTWVQVAIVVSRESAIRRQANRYSGASESGPFWIPESHLEGFGEQE